MEGTRHYVVRRDGEPSLEFTGTILASVNSDDGRKLHWSVLAIFRTTGNQYILETRGLTRKPGGYVLNDGRVFTCAGNLVTHVKSPQRRRNPAFQFLLLSLLERAADEDDAIAEVLDQIEQSQETVC